MLTTDQILLNLQYTNWESNSISFSLNDKRILNSFCNQLKSNKFLTENQCKLLVKIFKENTEVLKLIYSENLSFLEIPTWSQKFRVISQIKKIYTLENNNRLFFVEFSYNKKIKEALYSLHSKEKIEYQVINNKIFAFLFTETNIYKVIKYLKPFGFEISENLLNFYKEIDSVIKNNQTANNFFPPTDPLIEPHLIRDLGKEAKNNQLLMMDRRIRYGYQYDINFPINTLTTSIASRKKTKIWMNNNRNFNDIINSLLELKRFPVLFVLDQHNVSVTSDNLIKIHQTLKNYQKNCNVYFRFNNNTGKTFNAYIFENKLNKILDQFSDSAIIDNAKLPKFFFSANWYPKSVVSFTNTFFNNKGAVWCDQVDLVILYTERQPILFDHHYEIL
jgi:hypothetical protein